MNQIYNLLRCCDCPFFKNKYCRIEQIRTSEDYDCTYLDIDHNLDNRKAAKVLSYHNKWRRGKKGKMVSGLLVGMAIDKALQSLRKGIKNGD